MSRSAVGPSRCPIQYVMGHFPGVERPGLEVNHQLPFNSQVKNMSVASLLLSLLAFMAPTGATLRFIFTELEKLLCFFNRGFLVRRENKDILCPVFVSNGRLSLNYL